MRRSLAAAAVIALVLSVAPMAQAATPGSTTGVSGGWTWVNTGISFDPTPDGNLLISGTEVGTWTGSFRGTSTDVFQMTQTPPLDDPDHWGPGWGTLTAAFEGRVGNKIGSMTLYVTFWWAADVEVYTGTWTILAGTGGALKHVTGSGTWGTTDQGETYTYQGSVTWK